MSQISETLNFFYEFCRNPLQIGSLCPSSTSLCEEMLSAIAIDWNKSMNVAELGAGNGALTKLILNRLNERSTLDVFEINTSMLKRLEGFEDRKLKIIPESAENISQKYSLILSGLPFLSLSKETQSSILTAVNNALSDDGVFILFQYTKFFESSLSDYFSWDRKIVFNNFPPALVYRCKRIETDKSINLAL